MAHAGADTLPQGNSVGNEMSLNELAFGVITAFTMIDSVHSLYFLENVTPLRICQTPNFPDLPP